MTALFILGLAVVGFSLCWESVVGLRERDRDQTLHPMLAREKIESILAGDERSEEGDFEQPWQSLHWRLYREFSPEGLSILTLRVTRRDQVGKTLYQYTATRLEKDRP